MPSPPCRQLLLVAALAFASPTFAGGYDPNLVEPLKDGWQVHAETILAAPSAAERSRLISSAARALAKECSLDLQPDRVRTEDSIAVFLDEVVRPDPAVTKRQIYCADSRLSVNLVSRGEITQMRARFAPLPSAKPDAVGEAPRPWVENDGWLRANRLPGAGLSVWRRTAIHDPEDYTTPYRFFKHYDGFWAVEELSGEIVDDPNEPLAVKKRVLVKRREILEGGGSRESTIPGRTVVLVRIKDKGLLADIKELAFWRPPCEEKTLVWRLPDPPTRNQGDRGTCHLFASIGLLEAAIQGAYGLYVPLSEEDLAQTIKRLGGDPDQGGLMSDDVKAAQRYGVATRRAVPYPHEQRPRAWGAEERMRAELAALGLSANSVAAPPLPPAAVPIATPVPLEDERRVVREAIKDFDMDEPFPLFYEMSTKGERVKRRIIDHLCTQEQPVVIGLGLDEMPQWIGGKGIPPEEAKDTFLKEYHAVLVTGFYKDPATGKFVFKIRNSWGRNPDVREDDLWRVGVITALKAAPRPAPAGLRALAEFRP